MVHFGKRSRPSALALQAALQEEGYDGPAINFGYGGEEDALNSPRAIINTTNKRIMRQLFANNDVPAPHFYSGAPSENITFPVVGRPDRHREGRGFWLCNSMSEMEQAIRGTRKKAAATHFMEFIDIEREFRVHVVAGKSIKISEKSEPGNHRNGIYFRYPSEFNHKKTLRKVAVQAVEALGLHFGAVDIGWSDNQPYVFEVNTAPCLTDETSDTLDKYTKAIMEEYSGNDGVGIYGYSNSSNLDGDLDYGRDYCPCGCHN